MTIQVIEGQQSEILEKISRMSGKVTRAILWIDDDTANPQSPRDVDAIMADLNEDTVSVGFVDDSREAIYTRLEDE